MIPIVDERGLPQKGAMDFRGHGLLAKIRLDSVQHLCAYVVSRVAVADQDHGRFFVRAF